MIRSCDEIALAVFTGNAASRSCAAVLCDSATLTMDNCILRNNSAGDGDSVHDGAGAMWIDERATVRVNNCLFLNNTADGRGGAVRIRSFGETSVQFTNCTFSGNTATLAGDVIYTSGHIPAVRNSILWGNGPELIFGDSMINYSCVQGGWPGEGNIESDPGFVDPEGDFRLAAGSPCIDAADNDAVPASMTTDLSGLLRFVDDPATVDTGHGVAPIVDMGSYEFQAGLCAADIDVDGAVGFSDLILVLDAWSGAGPEDVDGSGVVDFADLFIVLASWGAC